MTVRHSHSLAAALAAGLLILLSAPLHAQDRLRGLVRLGLEHGGERVIEFEYTDGSSPDVVAGGGLLLTGGAALRLADLGAHQVEAQLNAGIKYRTIPPATNQDATWLRFPVEGLLYYRAPAGLRLGAGAVVHLRNVLEASGAVLDDRVEFTNTPGLLFQAEYGRGDVTFDARYTALKYRIQGGGPERIDASSFGLGLSWFFRR